ncbi:MAG: hypothetical protein ACXU8A_12080, partial [Burkholderiaceae bacterium]
RLASPDSGANACPPIYEMSSTVMNPFGPTLHIGLSKAGITVLQKSGWLKPQVKELVKRALTEDESASPAHLVSVLRGILTEIKCANMPATVILSDDWVRIWAITPPENVTSFSDCLAAASVRFHTLYGEPLTEWEVAADWNTRHAFLACAIPRSLLAALKAVSAEFKLTLLEIAPHFIVAWNRWHKELDPASWFGMLHDNVFTLGAIDQQRLYAVRAISMAADDMQDKNWLLEYVTCEALRLNLPVPSHIQVCGQVPAHWVSHRAGLFRCSQLGASLQAQKIPMTAEWALAHAGVRA